jgi:hypothetical protein
LGKRVDSCLVSAASSSWAAVASFHSANCKLVVGSRSFPTNLRPLFQMAGFLSEFVRSKVHVAQPS